ncbi:WAT1-related protein At1g43650-like isoform X1 [Salvia miltiorrhiza]|uniref:WAT1-related protein At1g43650-like isoform X1 n=1 Tax=Salvia miltiorrhiza TaxID=226208 RepID=UPI0025ACBF2E|nr:WAT1-related protein At1g43650-like isoform X1 [Salvia miltiorrhiza]
MELKKGIMNARVLLGMLVVQVIATGLQILSRVILSEGTFIFALMSYRNVVAAFAVAPFALYFERGALRKISFEAFLWLFMVALTGILMAMGLFYYGLRDTSATYATNFLNLIPAVTFVLSTILRIEKLNVHTKAGKMKIAGAMLCFAGALTMALYKGESFNLSIYNQHKILVKTHQNNTRGTMLLIGSCLSYGCWFILQVELFKVFPHRYSGTMIICIIASVQATLVGLCVDRKPMSWRLGWNLQLLTIFYSGVLATAATFALISMAIIAKGPTYPSMFNPLSLIFILIIEAIFFAQDLYIGSLIGMVLIITGLYSFLWGRQKDMKAAPPQLCLKDIGGGEDVEKIMESGGLQSSAIIAPATSPINVTAIHKFDEIS